MDQKLVAAPHRPALRLSRSNSNASVLGLKESPYPQHLYTSSLTKKSVIDELENPHLGLKQSSRKCHDDGHDHVHVLHPVPITIEQRQSRISKLLKEAKKENPLGKSQLFKMTLTFRSFVWEPTLYNIYGTSLSQPSKVLETEKVETPPVSAKVKKILVRSNSATSLKSNHSNMSNLKLIQNSEEPSAGISQKSVRKDFVKLSMLATPTSNDVKFKNQKGNNLQTDLPTQRSLKLGAIPRYLTSRKAEWARQEEEKVKNMPDPDCPPGHVAMAEHERMETLEKLKKNHQELVEEYNCLPVSKDTLRVRQKKEDIEKQLIKVEEGIRVLSKPKVFVRIDDPKETTS